MFTQNLQLQRVPKVTKIELMEFWPLDKGKG